MADKTTEKVIYSKEDYEADEAHVLDALNGANHWDVDWSPFKRLLTHDILVNTKVLENGYLGCVQLKDLRFALKYPRKSWRVILTASEELMRISPHYYRLCMYFANMGMINWGVDLYEVSENVNVNAMRKSYMTLIHQLERMNLKHEFTKILKVLPYQDIYCGLVFEDSSSFFIQQISYKVCHLYEVEDGLFNFVIDLDAISPRDILGYPEYVQEAYIEWHNAEDDYVVSYQKTVNNRKKITTKKINIKT